MTWRARLRQAIDATGEQDKAIAARAKIRDETLSRILGVPSYQPRLATIVAVAAAANVSVGWLLDEGDPFGDDAAEPELRQHRASLERLVALLDRRLGTAVASADASPHEEEPLAHVADRDDSTPSVDEPAEREIPQRYRRMRASRVLRARGDSMRDEGIADGDLLYVVTTDENGQAWTVEQANGRLAVVRQNRQLLLRRLFSKPPLVHLGSAHPHHPARIVDPSLDHFEVIGIVVGTTRSVNPTQAPA